MGLKLPALTVSVTLLAALNALAVTKVACVGNSITYGYGIESSPKKYPDHLQDMLGDQFEVKNFGNSGKMFHKASNESYWSQPTFTDAYNYAPDIVVIELGTNDSKYFFDGAGGSYNYYYYEYKSISKGALVNEMTKDYEALIDTFAHQPQSPKIYATLQPYAQNNDWFITDTAIVNTINPIIKDAATARGAVLIDLHSTFNKKEWLLNDVVHPNEEGAKELARIIADGILETPAESSSSEVAISPESSSSTENDVESTKTTLTAAKPEISTQGKAVTVSNYVGEISVFDLNGTLVKQVHSDGFSLFMLNRIGTYIVKAGLQTQKLHFK